MSHLDREHLDKQTKSITEVESVWELNLQNNTIKFSENWFQIFGYSVEDINTLEDWVQKVHPDDFDLVVKKYEDYLNNKTSMFYCEFRFLNALGDYRWIISRCVVITKAPDGTPAKLIGSHSDIHEQKLFNSSIKQNDSKYRQLFDYGEAIICTHNLQGELTSVNPYASKLLGYSSDELVGMKLSVLIPEPYKDDFDRVYLNKIAEKGHSNGILQLRTKEGKIVYLLYNNYLIVNGESYAVGIAQDITRRIELEEELKISRDTITSAFKYSGVASILLSSNGNYIEVNDAFCELIEYSREELLNVPLRDLIYEEDVDIDSTHVQKLLSNDINKYSIEKRFVSRNKKIVWTIFTMSLVRDKNDNPNFFVIQIIDKTKQQELSNKLQQKNIELEATKDSLAAKIQQLEEFSYVVAHNLRGPAKNIEMMAGILGESNGSNDINKQAFTKTEAVEVIRTASKSLSETLDTLIQTVKYKLDDKVLYEICDFALIIDSICSQLRGDIFHKGIAVKQNLNVNTVSYPKPYIENILYNLISNAVKYSNPKVESEIIINTTTENGKTIVSVKDNGIGIDLNKYGKNMFKFNQVFHQGYDSKGIGLFLIKTQIESLGGTIKVKSEVNKGSEFILII